MSPNSGIGPCLVLDTSNAFEGIITNYSKPVPNSQLGSNKRIVNIGDVIVSRLRPYLRQVAFVDEDIPFLDRSVSIVTSTEFFCLRRKQQQSIAFLVPLLLSDQVQQILGAAQEGGHHPRFNSDVLLNIPVPNEFLVQRDSVSQRIEESIRLVRESEKLRLHLRNLSEELLTAA